MLLLKVYVVGVPLGLLAALFLASGRNPVRILVRALHTLVATHAGRQVLTVILVVLGGVVVQGLLDPHITRALGYDLTARVQGVEGDTVVWFQSTLPSWGVAPTAWFYMAGYIVALALPLALWTGGGQPGVAPRAAPAYLLGFLANIVFALPFYVFFPVQEVAWSGLSEARPLLEQVWPGITAALRAGSALDNCFPSLHVSCTVTALVAARRYGSRALQVVAWSLALATGYSVLALGIHWGLDVLAGVPFGLLCARTGEQLARVVAPAE